MTDRFAAIRGMLAPVTEPGWIVGGSVRDLLMELPVADVDIALAGDAARAATALASRYGAVRFPLSDEFGAWRVKDGTLPFTVDITPLQGADLAEDLSRRDLTVNAIAVPLDDGAPVDPVGGIGDIARGRLRMVAESAFGADPVRVARLARLALQTGFTIDPPTRLRARMDAAGLRTVAGERVFDELGRIARHIDAWRGFELLDDVGALGVIVPELEEGRGLEQTPYHHKDVLGHTLEVVRHACAIRADPTVVFRTTADHIRAWLAEPLADELTRGEALVFGCLLHDMAKPATYAVTADGRATFHRHDMLGAEMADAWCRRYRTSARLRDSTALLVRRHLVLGFMVHRQPLSLRQVVRFRDLVQPADVEQLVLSCADRLATDGPRTTPPQIQRHLDLARRIAVEFVRLSDAGTPAPLLNGLELAALVGRDPGPWTAQAVGALREEQLVGLVTTRAQAERFVRGWARREAHGGGSVG